MREEKAARPPGDPGLVRDVDLEVVPAPADQVIANVRRAVVGRLPLGDLARALHAAQRHAQLRLAAGLRKFFHGLPVPIAALEVHGAIHGGGIALQHLLDQADALEVQRPVQRRAEAEAGDRVADRHLPHGQGLVFSADGILGRHALRGEARLDLRTHGRHEGSVFTHALKQPDHEGRLQLLGQRASGARSHDLIQVAVSLQARGAPFQRLLCEAAQVLDERQLEHAGPGPQFADGEWRHGLVGGSRIARAGPDPAGHRYGGSAPAPWHRSAPFLPSRGVPASAARGSTAAGGRAARPGSRTR